LAAYNSENDTFETLTKRGTGFTDEDLARLPKLLEKQVVSHKHPRVNSTLEADVWFEPAAVIEILGAETTLSLVHTCAMDSVRKGSGLAIQFPRFTGKYRSDKSNNHLTEWDFHNTELRMEYYGFRQRQLHYKSCGRHSSR
jgi:DNA ligase-1